MPRGRWLLILPMLVALYPSTAHADVPPLDGCMTAGASCMNALPDYQGAGTCRMSTCYRSVPSPDGGRKSMAYDCLLCMANGNGGSSGAGGATHAGGAANAGRAGTETDAGHAGGATDAGAGGKTTGNDGTGCDCVVTPARAGETTAIVFLAAGALALLAGRRSRRS